MVTRLAPQLNLVNNDSLPEDALGVPFGVAFSYDYRRNDFKLENGNIVIGDELEAVIQWIANTIIIEKNVFPVFSPDYGTYVYNLSGKGFPTDTLEIMIPDMIRTELLKDARIQNVDSFSSRFEYGNMFLTFRVTLVNSIVFNYDAVWTI